MSPAALRIIIADDQASVREGLVLLLGMQPDIDVVASANDGAQVLELLGQHELDAVLLDLHMPKMDGIETIKRLRTEHPDVAIVVLTTYVDDSTVLAALRAGARSYLTKDADKADIARALQSAAAGQSVLDPAVHGTLLNALDGPRADPPRAFNQPAPDGLTPREFEILRLIASQYSNQEIANQLTLSAHTVKTHINRIFAKTGSGNRHAAIRYARQHGLGDGPREEQ